MTTGPSDIRIIGVGNPFRTDDGAGIAVVRHLRERIPESLTLIEETGEGAALLETWRGASAVILVDAAHSGAAPGTIFRFDASAEEIPEQVFPCSSHAFSVSQAISLARVLNQLPPRLIVYGIQGKDFRAGVGLSAEVDQASVAVAERVLDELRTLQAGDPLTYAGDASPDEDADLLLVMQSRWL